MPISTESFRKDFPSFSNPTRYPPESINFWGAVANLLLGHPKVRTLWDTTPGGFIAPPLRPVLTVVAGGSAGTATCYAVTTYVTPQGETSQSAVAELAVPADNLLSVASPQNVANLVSGWNVYVGLELGTYILQNSPTAPIAIGTSWTEPTNGLLIEGGSPPQFNTSGPKSMLDLGVELFIAHNLALEVQAQDAARVGAVPGTVAGPITARSVNGVSVSYDGSSGIEADAGHWNLTIWGKRLIRMMNIVGAVPIQIGVGYSPVGWLNGPGWAGPPPFLPGSPGSGIY